MPFVTVLLVMLKLVIFPWLVAISLTESYDDPAVMSQS